MNREDLCEELLHTLRSAGFILSTKCPTHLSCFDFAARSEEDAILVRTSCRSNLVSKESARELAWIGSNLSATPLIVCLNGSGKPMKDDTIYLRHRIRTITPQTFRNVVERGDHPLVEARPGGFYVRLDGEAIRRRRSEAGLSLGELASMIGVSRRTIYGYECGLGKASVGVALKLEATFGVPVVRQTNLFRERLWAPGRTLRLRTWKAPCIEVAEKLIELGYKVAPVSMAPFDFVAVKDPKERIIGGLTGRDDAHDRRELSSSIADALSCHSLFIAEESRFNGPGTVSKEDFLSIREPEQLHKLLV